MLRLNSLRHWCSVDLTIVTWYYPDFLLPRFTIAPLQRVQNAAARVVARLGPRDHVTPTLKDRHWLPIEQRIVFKLYLLMYQVHTGRAPSYLRSCITASADMTSRPRLRSTNSQ